LVEPGNGKIILKRQTAHADAVAGLPVPWVVYAERLSQCE